MKLIRCTRKVAKLKIHTGAPGVVIQPGSSPRPRGRGIEGSGPQAHTGRLFIHKERPNTRKVGGFSFQERKIRGTEGTGNLIVLFSKGSGVGA